MIVLSLVLAAFPIPSIDGKPVSATAEQTQWTLPMRFDKAKKFYVERFKDNGEVRVDERSSEGRRQLVITTRATTEMWTKAVITEREVDLRIDVTRVMRLTDEAISGTARPLVEFVFTRSPDVKKAIDSIDHTESMRAK